MDEIIVISFLVLIFATGILAGKKIEGVKDYAIANQTYTTIPILLTLLATMIGGDDTTGDVAEFYQSGIIYALPYLGFIASILIVAKYIAPKFDGRFNGMISVSDVIEYFYGTRIAKVTAVVGTVATLGYAGAQNIALGHLFSDFMGVDYKTSVIISSGIVVLYTMFGGIRSVVVTDIIQFAILIIMIPIICNVAVTHLGGVKLLFDKTPSTHLSILNNKDFIDYLALFFIWAVPLNCLFPPMIQRFLMIKDTKKISQITYIYALVLFGLLLMMVCLSLSAVVLFPNIDNKAVIPYVINNLLPTGISGLAISGMIAVIMSTIDSNLNSASILFTHNVLNIKKINKLYLMRFNTLIIGILASLIALLDWNIINLIVFVQVILATGISIPLIAGLMGLSVKKRDFWWCISCSIVLVVFNLLGKKEIDYLSSFLITLAGSMGFCLSYILRTFKGISLLDGHNINRFSNLFLQKCRQATKATARYFFSIMKIADYANKSVKNYGANYTMFGVFSCVNYIVPYFMWSHEIKNHYPLILSMRVLAGIFCVGLLLRGYWSRRLERYFNLYWFFTLLYTLTLMPTVMFLLNNNMFEWLLNITLSIFILALLVEWWVFLFILALGVLVGYFICHVILGGMTIVETYSNLFLGVYLVIFSTLIGLTFSKKRDCVVNEKFNLIKLYGGFMAHELKTPLSQLLISIGTIRKIFSKSTIEQKKSKCIVTYKSEDYALLRKKIWGYEDHIMDGNNMIDNLLMSMDEGVVSAKRGVYDLEGTVLEVINNIPIKKKYKKKIKFHNGNNIKFYGSKEYVSHAISNIILNASKYALPHKSAIIDICIEGNALYIKDTGKGIAENNLNKIFNPFYRGDNGGVGLGLSFCKIVMEVVGGDIKCESIVNQYTKFILTFPKY